MFFTGLKIIDTCGNRTMTTTRMISLASDYGFLVHHSPTNFSAGNELGKPISKVSCQNQGSYYTNLPTYSSQMIGMALSKMHQISRLSIKLSLSLKMLFLEKDKNVVKA